MIEVESAKFKNFWGPVARKAKNELLAEIHKTDPKATINSKEFLRQFPLLIRDLRVRVQKKDFYFFLEDALEMKGLSPTFHGEMADFMMAKGNNKLVLAPRGHLKSTIITFGYALWRLMQNPDLRILIANYKLENAKSFLMQIKTVFQDSETFNFFYAPVIPDLKKTRWNESQILIRRTKNMKEGSIEVTGVGGEVTGKHFDLIIYDDVVGPENIATLEQVQKLRTWFNQMQAILEPDGDQVLVGTRWHFADLYGFIMDNMADQYSVFHKGVYAADGSPVWPEKFTAERVENIRKRMESDPNSGRQMFVAQYLNQVIDEKNASFKRTLMRFFSPGEEPTNLAVSIAVDPAISEKETADRTAFTVRGVDEKGQWWILETIARRGVTPTEIVDKLFELYAKYSEKYSVDAIGVEAQAYQKSLMYAIQDEMKKRGVFFNLVELGNWRSSKELRIKGLIPRYDMGMILFRKPGTGDDSEILVDELLRFPKSPNDDAIDSLSFHLNLQVEPGPSYERQASEDQEIVNGRDRYGQRVEETTHSSVGMFV